MGVRSLFVLGAIRPARFAGFFAWLCLAMLGLATVAQAQVQVSSTTLPFGGINQSYSAQLTATGGVPPYFWSTPVTDTPSGPVTSLPPGYSLASNGLITGSTKISGV